MGMFPTDNADLRWAVAHVDHTAFAVENAFYRLADDEARDANPENAFTDSSGPGDVRRGDGRIHVCHCQHGGEQSDRRDGGR